ncbi:MAG: TolC family outer membrane protein [Rhodospirillales bacterium]
MFLGSRIGKPVLRNRRILKTRPELSWIAGAVALASLLTLLFAGASHARSLEEELSFLLSDNPQIQAQVKRVEAAHADINRNKAAFLPSVTATANAGPEIIDSPGERAANGKQSSEVRQQATLSVTQNLFNGFATSTRVKVSRLNKALATLSLEGTRQNKIFEGITHYVDVLRQRRLVGLSRNNEETIKRQLRLEDERVRRGSGIAVDVLQAKSRLQIAKERRVTFEGALENAVSRYMQVFNRPPDIDRMTDPAPPVDVLPSELDRVLDIALLENPAINNANTAIEVARTQRNLVKSEFFPNLDMVGSWNFEKDFNTVLGTRQDYSVVLQANWDLFSGFSTRHSLSQANFNYRASQDDHDQAARQVVQQSRLSWQALLTARERAELLANAVNIASEVAVARKKLREAGKETVINVLDANNEVINAQINYVSATYDEIISIYQMMLSMGRLNTAYLNVVTH